MANCNYKLLKDAHIGYGVRITKDKNTIPFTNEPMTGMKIEDYSKLGFRISHPNMGKVIWVEFKQLPLTKLTIVNGIIQDEITFVENIIAHQMELIKTDDAKYLELVKIKEEEKFKEFTTLSHIQPGETVISALCKEGIPMTYIGTWYIKGIYRDSNIYSSYYHHERKKDKFYLTKQSSQRAFFIVDSDNLTPEEEEIITSIKLEDISKLPDEDYNDYWKRQYIEREKGIKERNAKKTELLILGSKNRYKIISYPITSKRVKKFIKTNVFNNKFTNLEFNKEMILNQGGRYDWSFNGSEKDQTQFAKLKVEYPNVKFDDFLIVNRIYELSEVKYLTDNKTDINKKAYDFINENYMCTLEPNKVVFNKDIEEIELS